ncbi:acetoacetate decarboxylase family protein [Roseovarius sp. ZX-A-9]|uniref:acetoacetate decarboxylase family protein n=1 Tax=Roseovarius sp. ZX-A-9 TaxID=3014783 RepID=UPI00232B4BE2|nr:acetoacetate decarboxylase family protein [Roseovarius sp. ZX-A-9]
MTMPFATPHAAPLYAALPYHYRNVTKISAYCRCDPKGLRQFLPPDFEVVGDVCELFIMEAPDAGPLGSYNEAGLVIPARYGDLIGAHVALEYVETDDSMAAGREIWGYPKKLADVPMTVTGNAVSAQVIRRGVQLMGMDFTPGGNAIEKPVMQPRLQVRSFPAADGPLPDCYQIISNQVTGFVLHDSIFGTVDLKVVSGPQDPLEDLGVIEVLGAELSRYDFLLGYGEVVKDLSPSKTKG